MRTALVRSNSHPPALAHEVHATCGDGEGGVGAARPALSTQAFAASTAAVVTTRL